MPRRGWPASTVPRANGGPAADHIHQHGGAGEVHHDGHKRGTKHRHKHVHAVLSGNPFAVRPVPGGSFVNSWGAPRSGGRDHMGTDIMASDGKPILAPFDGTLRFYNAGETAGWAADVQGAKGVCRNFHCRPQRAHADGKVKAGDVIAYVSYTGNASPSSPHSHFEWHPGVTFSGISSGTVAIGERSNGTAVNPYHLLREVYGMPGTGGGTPLPPGTTDPDRGADVPADTRPLPEAWIRRRIVAES